MNWLLLKNSLAISAAVLALATVFGFVAALCVLTLGRPWRWIVTSSGVVALLLPPFLVTSCWLHYLGLNGVWRGFLSLDIYSLPGAILILAMLYWPVQMLALLAAWRRIELTHLEADPWLRGWSLIRFLLWPRARPMLTFTGVVVFVLALNNFAVPSILQIKTVPANLWVNYNTNLDTVAAVRAGLPLIVAPVILLVHIVKGGFQWPFHNQLPRGPDLQRQLGPVVTYVSTTLTFLLIAFSVCLPIGQVIVNAGTWAQLPAAIRAAAGTISNSFFFAAITATCCLILGLLLWRVKATSVLWLLYFSPGVFIGMLLIPTFNRPGLGIIYGTSVMVIIACALRYSALGWSAMRLAMRAADTELTDAALLEGARGFSLFRYVYWPQIAPYAAFAWYAIYLLCLWDVETLVLVLPPGGETLAVRIFNLLHYGHTIQVDSLCLILLAVALAPLPFIGRLGTATAQPTSK